MSAGVYPLKPDLPAVGGGEGVGVVRETGGSVTSVKNGDWVIPARPSLGTVKITAHFPNSQPFLVDSTCVLKQSLRTHFV